MPRVASSTGLIAAKVRPVGRPKPKKIELLGLSMPAPFTLRPFAGLFNPYHYGCSVFCNHPADDDAKEVVRKAKDNWASEGKSLIISSDVVTIQRQNDNDDGQEVPEELFRRYTETDSRPISPELIVVQDDSPPKIKVPHRPTLVLDLRATSQVIQDHETFSWRALTLEPIPSGTRKSETFRSPLSNRRRRDKTTIISSTSPVNRSLPVLEISESTTSPLPERKSTDRPLIEIDENKDNNDDDDDVDDDDGSSPENKFSPVRRRGKLRRKKRKGARRFSIYGQQTEVREPPDPLETQVSQIDEISRRGSTESTRLEDTKEAIDYTCEKTKIFPTTKQEVTSSFLPPDVLKELSRNLNQQTVEWEFNAKRRFALEEALRVKKELCPLGVGVINRQPLQSTTVQSNVPRLFYRQSARFELLDSSSLIGLEPLDYLGRYVHVNDTRKLIFERAFSRYRDETNDDGPRLLSGHNIYEALAEVLGRQSLGSDQINYLNSVLLGTNDATEHKLDFRTWCGVCAFVERVFPELPNKSVDQPSWLERADFELLERRLRNVCVNERLAMILRLIRDC